METRVSFKYYVNGCNNEEARRAVHLSTDINKIKVKCDQFKKAISMMESEVNL